MSIGFKVLSQTVTTGKDVTGVPSSGHLVTAALPSGTQFQVFVPDRSYTVQNVTDLLAAKAKTVAAVDAIAT
jgi:hypothetical protein